MACQSFKLKLNYNPVYSHYNYTVTFTLFTKLAIAHACSLLYSYLTQCSWDKRPLTSWLCCQYILYTYKFLRHVNFKDVTNPAFLWFYFRGLLSILLSDWYKPKFCQWNFEDEKFSDGQLTVKTSKITSLKNLYIYTVVNSGSPPIHCIWTTIVPLFVVKNFRCYKINKKNN